jgi:hypothetical protein
MELFFEEYVHRLDPQTTGLLLIHAINPWGMHNWKARIRPMLSINRNFIDGDFARLKQTNPDLPGAYALLHNRKKNPSTIWPVQSWDLSAEQYRNFAVLRSPAHT